METVCVNFLQFMAQLYRCCPFVYNYFITVYLNVTILDTLIDSDDLTK